MFKYKIILAGVSLALLLGLLGAGGVIASDGSQQDEMPEDAVGSYTMNGEFHWIVPGEGIKVVAFSGMTKAEVLSKIQMSAKEEATVVHETPPCSIIIDGVLYEPEQIHLFDGKQLGFVMGKDGLLYAFTTEDRLQKFKQEQSQISPEQDTSVSDNMTSGTYSHFYYDWFYGEPVINLDYRVSLANLPPGWDNNISSEQISILGTACRLYDYVDFGGDYFEQPAGSSYAALWLAGWNDRASSILHY